MPEISILTAALVDTEEKYQWLEEAVASVQAQDFTDWEMIIVDDASPMQVQPFDDPRVRVVRASHHQGPSMCRNTAVGLARADCLLPLDADDKLAPNALGVLFANWQQNPNQIVYGDMQYLQDGQLGKIVKFPAYEFSRVLDPKGVIPVTAMHSRACWEAAGGWKADLADGLEDVEYWIAAGAAGYCGVKLDEVTLLYRKHTESRTQRMRDARQEGMARNTIRQMHEDLYQGRFPMGCCSGSRSKPLTVARGIAGNAAASPTPIGAAALQYSNDTIWCRYNGRRTGQFGVRGQATGQIYKVHGQGHEFEIFAVDANIFRRSGRGKDFSVGIAPPAKAPEAEPETPQPQPYQAPAPKLAQIIELDAVARGEQGGAPGPEPKSTATPPGPAASPPPLVETQPVAAPMEIRPGPPRTVFEPPSGPAPAARQRPGQVQPGADARVQALAAQYEAWKRGAGPAASYEEFREAMGLEDDGALRAALGIPEPGEGPMEVFTSLAVLDLDERFVEVLESEGWTVEGLAGADPNDLVPYPGIGKVTAAKIIAAAQAHSVGAGGD